MIGNFSRIVCPFSSAELVASACENTGAGALATAGISVGVNVTGDLCEGAIFENIDSDAVLGVFDVAEKDEGWEAKGDDGLAEGGSITFVTKGSEASGSVARGRLVGANENNGFDDSVVVVWIAVESAFRVEKLG